jgi:hypothetical protein
LIRFRTQASWFTSASEHASASATASESAAAASSLAPDSAVVGNGTTEASSATANGHDGTVAMDASVIFISQPRRQPLPADRSPPPVMVGGVGNDAFAFQQHAQKAISGVPFQARQDRF